MRKRVCAALYFLGLFLVLTAQSILAGKNSYPQKGASLANTSSKNSLKSGSTSTTKSKSKKHKKLRKSAKKTKPPVSAKPNTQPTSQSSKNETRDIKPTVQTTPSSNQTATSPHSETPESSIRTAKQDKQSNVQIDSIKQTVEVQSDGHDSWSKARTKTPLQTNDRIRTGRQSVARLRMDDGTKVLLLQNSQAHIENLSSLQRAIKLTRGRLRAIVSKLQGTNTLSIKTPIGVACVRGTEFEVEFFEEDQIMAVEVVSGQVGVSRLGDLAQEVRINPGEKLIFGTEGDLGVPLRTEAIPIPQQIRMEAFDTKTKDAVVSMAAEELRNADYQTGKSLIDVDGQRVRVEEYIMRPEPNQFKLVSLNERPNRFDYFTYLGTFNKDLPDDLSIALKDVSGKLGDAAPDYFLTDYEMLMSNTIDTITDTASGGHLVRIDFNGSQYTLTDPDNLSNTRTIDAAALQADGSYKIYNPLKDSFSSVSAGEEGNALKIGIWDSGTYRNIEAGNRLWKTRFDSSSMFINTTAKTAFSKKATVDHTLAIDLDADFYNAPIGIESNTPDGSGVLHNRLRLYYGDGSATTYETYIIDDEGNVAPSSAFSGIATSEDYQNELLNWNYQQKVTSTEMQGEINLVIDPRIGTMSGLFR